MKTVAVLGISALGRRSCCCKATTREKLSIFKEYCIVTENKDKKSRPRTLDFIQPVAGPMEFVRNVKDIRQN